MARLLVVDDDEGVRRFVAEALETGAHQVADAASGEEALRLAKREAFDVVFTDLKMPGMGGQQLLRRLRAEHPETEVVVLTAHGDVATAVACMRAGAFDFLEKPVGSLEQLRALAARAAEHRALRLTAERATREQPGEERLTYGAPAMAPVVEELARVARTEATVLLRGESGTGKEVAAREIHRRSRRARKAFVAVNASMLASDLAMSELFGHEKGAFTGASARRRGRIELAEGGTFFLDEVGELEPKTQAKLLRVLQERTFERVGGAQTLHADVRWVAATNRDLHAMIREGSFREDLYHRLAVFPVELPPLRARREDIDGLARRLLVHVGAELGRPRLTLAPEALAQLRAAPWPGNIRELRNTLERAAILSDGDRIEAAALRFDGAGVVVAIDAEAPRETLAAMEERAIRAALAASDGNRKEAAASLGIAVRTLYDKLRRLDGE
ncbi:MAG: sigma-54 dependent transcriptional regulator [Myxococcota bacterium]